MHAHSEFTSSLFCALWSEHVWRSTARIYSLPEYRYDDEPATSKHEGIRKQSAHAAIVLVTQPLKLEEIGSSALR